MVLVGGVHAGALLVCLCLLAVISLGVQAYDAWQALGGWISQNEPDFGPGVKERFANASRTSAEQV